MSIRTTLTLDEDVMARLKDASKERGIPFRQLVNEVLRNGLQERKTPARKPFKMDSASLGLYPGLNYDNIGELIELAEGPFWR